MSSRILAWTDEAWDSYVYWRREASPKGYRFAYTLVQNQDKKTLKRINKLIKAAKSTPFTGIGKPEPLKENLSGLWSRRIDDTNRLVYAVSDRYLTIISCRFHY
jgi:toxin YoeB